MVSGKQELEKLFADLGNLPLGREVAALDAVDSSNVVIRADEGVDDVSLSAIHEGAGSDSAERENLRLTPQMPTQKLAAQSHSPKFNSI